MYRNTTSAYGSVAKVLHWLMALWFVLACLIIVYLTWDHGTGPVPQLNYHKVVGFTLLLPLLLRVVWRWKNPAPALPTGMPRWQRLASRISHRLLYALLLFMPVTGYLGNGGGVDYGLFQIPPFMQTALAARLFDALGITAPQWDRFFDLLHYGITGPWLLPALLALHAGAALYHHWVLKDDILQRMLPGR